MDFQSIDSLKNISKKIALIEAVIEPEWEYRYYSYNSKWSDSEEMASMRDGSGNYYFILFSGSQCFIKVIDKMQNFKDEAMRTLDAMDIDSQKSISAFLNEPAFYTDELSYLYWNTNGTWNSIEMNEHSWLNILHDPVPEYIRFAKNYYDKTIPKKTVSTVINEEVSLSYLVKLNPDIDINSLKTDIDEIGLIIK